MKEISLKETALKPKGIDPSCNEDTIMTAGNGPDGGIGPITSSWMSRAP